MHSAAINIEPAIRSSRPFTRATLPRNSRYVPNLSVYRTDNRSSYNGLMLHLQGNVSNRLNLVVNYTLSKAKTWGCVLGELFDYVNGVCDPLNAFAKGDYGPSGENVTSRFVLAGTFHLWGGIELAAFDSGRKRPALYADHPGGRKRLRRCHRRSRRSQRRPDILRSISRYALYTSRSARLAADSGCTSDTLSCRLSNSSTCSTATTPVPITSRI